VVLIDRYGPRRSSIWVLANNLHLHPLVDIVTLVLLSTAIGKKNSVLCAYTGIQHIEWLQCYLPLVNYGALRGKHCNLRSARRRLDAPSLFTCRRALISAHSLLRMIFFTCRRYSWRGDDDSHHLPLYAQAS